ncbi:MAG TPA: hypothetical protein VGD17_07710 [Chitinophagaceae bacterium]
MIFSLEILQANHGDCLLLYYGNNADPKVIVIDGGPSGIYNGFLKPRLLELRDALSVDKPLPLSLVMVSHLDDDHVNGILAMTQDMLDRKENNEVTLLSMKNIWCNTFDDIIGNLELPAISGLPASAAAASTAMLPQIAGAESHIAAVIVSTGQGRKLRDNAALLSATVNNPFEALEPGKANLVRGDGEGSVIEWDPGLEIIVVHPEAQRLKELQKKWDADLKKAKQDGDDSIIFASITDPDKSPFNLSSIVCLVEFNNKRMLLTGDGRSDDIVEGLRANDLLDNNGRLHVDILKLPHHGSIRNMDADFFQVVTADHYVISANGRDDNPDQELLDVFAANVTEGTLHLTNRDGKNNLEDKIDAFQAELANSGSNVKLNIRKPDGSIIIDLLDKFNF